MADQQPTIFEQLNAQADPKLQEEKTKAAIERERRQYEETQGRLAGLIDTNSTLPCTISSIRILNAYHTRRGFLEKILNPLLSANNDRPYTLSEALKEVSVATEKLHRFDIFHQPISLFIDRPTRTDPSSTPTDIDVYLSVTEKPRLFLKTGTDVGNAEGSAYGNLLYRNIFGGAETLSLNAALGTRTRSAYQASFDTPLFSNPDLRVEVGGIASATKNVWASHEEVLKSGWTKLRWFTRSNIRHELSYTGAWRQLTGLATNASPTVRADAGDSFKNSIAHTWINDQRDNPFLPSQGFYSKSLTEIAGWGPLKGDVGFLKSEIEAQSVVPVGTLGNGITFTTGIRGGLLVPFGVGWDPSRNIKPSRINDRFQLGGPNDVRGFRVGGLGPRDGPDAVGGDVYLAGGASLLFPLPGVGPERPLRWQLFVNGGRLLALKQAEEQKQGSTDMGSVYRSVSSTVKELGRGMPSTTVGIGLVYAHPAARFELNFGLPLVLRKGEDARKGLQFGIGINFL